MAHTGERLGQRGGVLVEPVRNPVQVLRRDDDPRRERPVDERADRAALRAEVDPPVAAPLAEATRREVRLGDDACAEPAGVDALAELRDDARDLVAHRDGRDARELVRLDMEIGAADAGAAHLDARPRPARAPLGPLCDPDVPDPGPSFARPLTCRDPEDFVDHRTSVLPALFRPDAADLHPQQADRSLCGDPRGRFWRGERTHDGAALRSARRKAGERKDETVRHEGKSERERNGREGGSLHEDRDRQPKGHAAVVLQDGRTPDAARRRPEEHGGRAGPLRIAGPLGGRGGAAVREPDGTWTRPAACSRTSAWSRSRSASESLTDTTSTPSTSSPETPARRGDDERAKVASSSDSPPERGRQEAVDEEPESLRERFR